VYVYGLTAAGRDVDARGIGDAPVSTVEHGELAAIVSAVGVAPLRAKRRDLLRHSDVLQAAFTDAPVVPLRFGTVFSSKEELVGDFLGARYEELVALLQRVEGLAELRVRASFVERALLAEVVRDDPRVAALRAAPNASQVELGEAVAHAVAARRVEAADEAVATLAGHAIQVQADEPSSEYEVLRASFLVDRRHVTAFELAAEQLAQRQRGRITMELVGPMPPHSFVSLGGGRR